jgi:hypothetical protein
MVNRWFSVMPNDAAEKPHSGASGCFRPLPDRNRSSSFQPSDLRFIVVP